MRRVIAAVAALVLATVGAVLIVGYANGADARASAGLETEGVVVALEEIEMGTPAAELEGRVEVREVPGSAVIDGAVSDLSDVQSLVLTTTIVPGEQLARSRFVTADELRARGETKLPDELANHHQVTILLDKARALGGDIAPGDTVGVFMSFDIDVDENGDPVAQPEQESSEGESEAGTPVEAGNRQVSVTDLTLHRVPVVRVEGAFVAPSSAAKDGDEAEGSAEDRIFVTLALKPEDAARTVFASEWGSIWLSLEPEGAPEDEIPSIFITLPERGQDVLQ